MALSQDEQRMLAEIERRLAADDPSLASCLTTFRRPGPAAVLRSPRARIVGSLFTVLLVAMVSLMVYAMVPFRTHVPRNSPASATGAPTHAAISAVSSSQPSRTHQPSAGPTVTSTAGQGGTAGATAAAADAKSQQAKIRPSATDLAAVPQTTGP
jgi:hypothetical protein